MEATSDVSRPKKVLLGLATVELTAQEGLVQVTQWVKKWKQMREAEGGGAERDEGGRLTRTLMVAVARKGRNVDDDDDTKRGSCA